MGAARVLAAPSVTSRSGDTEGLPMTVVEALATGTPVVGSRHAGIPEAVIDGRTGLLVPEGDDEALADGLLKVLSKDELWDDLSAAGRAHAERAFDLHRQTEALEDLYAEFA
jgi:glycosyltransferase involved in cell wall biosynthesis